MDKLQFYGLSEQEYSCCMPQIKAYSQYIGRLIVTTSAILMWILFLISVVWHKSSGFNGIYLCFAIVFTVFASIDWILKKRVTRFMQYIYIVILFCFASILSVENPISSGTTFHVMFVVLPLLIVDRAGRTWLFIICSALVYGFVILNFKNSSAWFSELYNLCCFSVVSCTAHWVVSRDKVHSFLLHVQNKEMIDELTAVRLKLKDKANRDDMTKLYNRSKFQKEIHDIQQLILEKDQSYAALFVIDVDKFKQINDIYGHHQGDLVLLSIAEVLLKEESEQRFFSRLGGDEFAGYYHNYKDCATLRQDIQQLCDKLNSIEFAQKQHLQVSLGAVMFKQNQYESFKQIYTLADKQMYIAKQEGKGISLIEI